MKSRINLLLLLLTVSFVAVLILNPAAPVQAYNEYRALSAPMLSDNEAGALGAVLCVMSPGCLNNGDSVVFRLPYGLVWSRQGENDTPMTNSDWVKDGSDLAGNYYGQRGALENPGNHILVPQMLGGDDNALYDVELEVTMLSEREIRVQIIGEPSPQDDAFMYIHPKYVWVGEGYYGQVNLVADAPLNSGFPDGTITIAHVNVIGGTVSVNVTGVDTFRDKEEITLRITEAAHSGLIAKNESVKLELPSGFTWSNMQSITTIKGDKDYVDSFITIRTNENELIMDVGGVSESVTSIEFKVTINAAYKVFARPGVVIVKASGASDVSPSRLWAGEYNPYDLNEDGDTNILDLLYLSQLINDGCNYEETDVNFDGRVDLLDLLTVAQNMY